MTLAAHYLAVLTTPGLGVKGLWQLVAACGGLEAVLAGRCPAPETDVATAPNSAALVAAVRAALPGASRAVAEARASGLAVHCWEDAGYPAPLRSEGVYSAPVLFVAGRLPAQLTAEGPPTACAIVGTRRASSYAQQFARDVARAAAARGVTVVSGLALGVDAAAHEGALEAGAGGGGTVAVLGGGHARLHPAANRGLAERILRAGGAILSEWPPTTNPQPYHFLRRNRVVVALSRVVAVVEAGVPSGALNSATHAAELDRQVLSMPTRPDDVRNRGGLQLLREGAAALVDASDILAHFALPLEAPASPPDAVGAQAAPNAVTTALLRALGQGGGASLDQLLHRTGAAPPDLLAALGLLELEGVVARTLDGRYRRRG